MYIKEYILSYLKETFSNSYFHENAYHLEAGYKNALSNIAGVLTEKDDYLYSVEDILKIFKSIDFTKMANPYETKGYFLCYCDMLELYFIEFKN